MNVLTPGRGRRFTVRAGGQGCVLMHPLSPWGLGPVAVGNLCQSLADTVAHDLSSLSSSVK